MSARAAVWGTWAGLTAAAVAFVLRFGRNCPLLDEWGMLDALAGRRPLLAFLWEPHAEHRYPAPRLVYALLFHTFHDLRAAMLASAVGLSAAAALLVAAAGRARGRPAAVDIVFPLLLLHWGHWENLLMAYQVCFVAVAVLVAVLLLLAATDRWGWGGTLFAAGAAVVLPGCGNLGLGYAPVAAVWLAFEAARGRRVGPRQGAVLVLAAGLALGLAGLAALHYPGSSGHLPERRAGEAVRFLVADLGLGFGTETRAAWPLFGAVGLVAVVAAGGGVASARRSRADAAGLTLLLAGGLGVAGAVAWGRCWAWPQAPFLSRYVLPAGLLTATALLAVIRYGSPGARRIVPAACALLAAGMLPVNARDGLRAAALLNREYDSLAADWRAGWPAELIGRRYDYILLMDHPALGHVLDRAAADGFEPLADRGPVRPVRFVPGSVDWPGSPAVAPSGDGHRPLHPGAAVRVSAPPGPVVGLCVRGEFRRPRLGVAAFTLRWRAAESGTWQERTVPVFRHGPWAALFRVAGPAAAVELLPDRGDWVYRVDAVEWIVESPE